MPEISNNYAQRMKCREIKRCSKYLYSGFLQKEQVRADKKRFIKRLVWLFFPFYLILLGVTVSERGKIPHSE